MDGTTSPGWGSGHEPVDNNPLPAAFVTFFPVAQEGKTEISWADNLVAQKPATIPRAWCRVPVSAGPSTLRKGMTIMKRVGRVARVVAASQAAAEIEVAEDLEEAQQANRRRLNSFVPTAADAVLELVGEPLSRAEVASAVMRAKVDVANCYLHEEYTDVSEQRNLAKQSQYTKKTVPLKRRFSNYSSVDFEYASGGNGYAIYSELHPILSRAMQSGVTEIDVNMASIAEAGVHLRSMSRNPRVLLAASGVPELSDIADDSEPSSVLTLEPNESMSDAKSPTKRASTQSPSPTKSSKSFRKRLSDTIVRLLPGSSPRAEPSPIKPSSPPTPSKDFESPRQQTPSITIPKSPSASKLPLLSANSTPGLIRWSNRSSKESPFARWRPKRKSEPARLSTTPSSPRNDSSTFDISVEDSSIMFGSPTHQSRPQAPTPSKWSGLLSSTPNQKASSAAATPANDGASLGLVKSLPEWMQHNRSPATLDKYDPSNVEFRPSSPSFTNSASWVNVPTDSIEIERTKIVRRRKSEPLVRNMLKSHTLRRTSLSPQLRSSGAKPTIDEPAFPSDNSISRIPERSQTSNLFNSSATQSNTLNNAVTEQTEDMDAQDMQAQDMLDQDMLARGIDPRDPHDFHRLSWDYKAQIEDMLRERRKAPPPLRHPDDVFDDPNDRYRRESPPPHNPVERLARMAETGCYDKAGVIIAERGERLLVQFKLPIKYIEHFPQDSTAGRDPWRPDPHAHYFQRKFPGETPSPEPRQRSEWSSSPLAEEESHLADKTLVVSDFGGSPTKRASLSAENEESHLADKTLAVSDFGSPLVPLTSPDHEYFYPSTDSLMVSDFGSPAKPSTFPDHEDFYPSDNTLIVSDFATSPAKRGSSSRQSIATSSPAPASQKVPFTPADQFIIPDYVTTSERKVYQPGMVYKPDMNSQPLVAPELPTIPELAVNTDSSSLSDLENTPPLNESSALSIAIMAAESAGEQSAYADADSSPTDSTTANDPPSTSPISFTPVNQASAQKKAASPTISNQQGSSPSPESGKPYPISHDDTPERDYLRDFIRRSKPRRLSTTETGSPIAIAPVQRQPLGARSPNMETQPKEKRKFESSEGEENENENENEPAAKRVRRVHRSTPQKPKPAATMNHSDDEDPLAKDVAPTSVKTSDAVDELANHEEQKEAPVPAASRRSSRLKTKPSAIPKPSTPAPTKVGRGRPPNTLGSVRNEQQDLVHQTRANTRRNKGNAEYPAQFLARHSEEEDEEESQQDEAETSKAGRGKSVVWKEPLASYQEEEKPKRGRPAKAKATVVGSRVSKPAAKPSAAAQKQRSSRIAAGLGMAGNGTPAPKPTSNETRDTIRHKTNEEGKQSKSSTMATETVTATTELRLASPSGVVTRKILNTPLRDALPSEIPIIDISPIFSSSLDERQAVAQQVRAAAQNMGFFYIKNHGIPADVIQDVYEAGLEFFRQDLEIKMRADSSGTRWDKGYQGPNTQRLNPVESVDLRESFSYQYDPRWDDTVGEDGMGDIPEEARGYLAWEDDYPWEQTRNLPRLKESMMRHMGECLRLARALTRCFALSLGLEEGLFDDKVRYPGLSYVINYYPPIEPSTEQDARKSEEGDEKVSIGSHTDFQLFTILWQDLHGGLEVLNKEGQWIRAKPIEGTLVVNLGDCMQRITNDEYTSTVHRARNYSGKERVSIPVFWGFGLHETCSVVGGKKKKKYEDVKCADWIMMRIRGMKQLE